MILDPRLIGQPVMVVYDRPLRETFTIDSPPRSEQEPTMTPDQIALARRLTEHPAFKWMPGMCAINEHARRWRLVANVTTSGHFADGEGHNNQILGWERTGPLLGGLPDLTDPATVGCLLALVREVWRAPYAKVTCIAPAVPNLAPPTWSCDVGPWQTFHAPTEGEALALALLEVSP